MMPIGALDFYLSMNFDFALSSGNLRCRIQSLQDLRGSISCSSYVLYREDEFLPRCPVNVLLLTSQTVLFIVFLAILIGP